MVMLSKGRLLIIPEGSLPLSLPDFPTVKEANEGDLPKGKSKNSS